MALPVRNSRLRLSMGQVFWREVGAGVPVVLLHGAWSDQAQWEPLLQALGDRYHGFAPDLLGFGESTVPRKTPYSVGLQADALAEWLDSLRLGSVYLVAEGLGAWVAAYLALRDPERVRGLVLLAPEGTGLAPHRWRSPQSLVGRFPWRAWGLGLLAPVARVLGWRWVQQGLAQRRLLRRFPASCQILFLRRSREIVAEQVGDRLPWLKQPVLLLQGEAATDPAVLALNRAYLEAPLADLHSVPGGDDPLVEGLGAIAQEIHTFITTHP